jgi:hypothetical protein
VYESLVRQSLDGHREETLEWGRKVRMDAVAVEHGALWWGSSGERHRVGWGRGRSWRGGKEGQNLIGRVDLTIGGEWRETEWEDDEDEEEMGRGGVKERLGRTRMRVTMKRTRPTRGGSGWRMSSGSTTVDDQSTVVCSRTRRTGTEKERRKRWRGGIERRDRGEMGRNTYEDHTM